MGWCNVGDRQQTAHPSEEASSLLLESHQIISSASAIPAYSCRHKGDAQNWKERERAEEERDPTRATDRILSLILGGFGKRGLESVKPGLFQAGLHTQPCQQLAAGHGWETTSLTLHSGGGV